MAIPLKNNTKANFLGRYPDELPQLPQAAINQIPELRKWQEDLNKFWLDFRLALARERDELLTKIES